MARNPLTQQHILKLLDTDHILSAQDIVSKLQAQNTGVNKTTVYRALEKLLADGVLCRQIFRNDTVMYELRKSHHDHLVCQTCGDIQAVECQQHPASSIQGFQVDHHHMTLFGICKNCS